LKLDENPCRCGQEGVARLWTPRRPKNPAGQLDVKLGGGVFSAPAIIRAPRRPSTVASGKGQIKQQDEAYVYLGRAQDRAQELPRRAKKAFVGLKGVPNISQRVLKLWELYAGQARLVILERGKQP